VSGAGRTFPVRDDPSFLDGNGRTAAHHASAVTRRSPSRCSQACT
jgi:hypothetical protein